MIEDQLDDFGLRVNGKEFFDFEDMDEVDQEPLSRKYKIFVPYSYLDDSNDLTVEAISSNTESSMLFKPNKRTVTIDKKELDKSLDINFQVIEGVFVKGKTDPPISDVKVMIYELNKSTITDSDGKFSIGPFEKGDYTVNMTKEDYTFTRLLN